MFSVDTKTDTSSWAPAGYDAIVFAGIAVVIGCLCRGRFNNLFILIAGEQG